MKTLKRRIVSSAELSEEVRNEYRAGHQAMNIPGRLTVETKFATIPTVMTGSKLESDLDLDKKWLHSKINDARYHWCHLHMTEAEWQKAGVRDNLKGSSGVVEGRMITYGRWPIRSMVLADKFVGIVRSLTEVARGSWHEGAHASNRLLAEILGIPYSQVRQRVHQFFYGWKREYTEAEELAGGSKLRYEITPDPIAFWQSLPWEVLPDIGVIIAPPSSIPALRPAVERRKEQLIKLMEMIVAPIKITEAGRSAARQAELWAQGRTTPGPIVTYAKPGESMHEYGLAFDIAFQGPVPYPALSDLKWQHLFKIAEILGLESYGQKYDFDFPHFQYLAGYTEDDVRAKKVDYQKFN